MRKSLSRTHAGNALACPLGDATAYAAVFWPQRRTDLRKRPGVVARTRRSSVKVFGPTSVGPSDIAERIARKKERFA